jgi:hypothetical protein
MKHLLILAAACAIYTSPADASSHYHRGCNATATWDCRSLAVKHEFWELSGHPHGWKGHIVDHRRALVCGGIDAVENMQWETVAEAKAKDRWETIGCKDGRRVGPPAPGMPE